MGFEIGEWYAVVNGFWKDSHDLSLDIEEWLEAGVLVCLDYYGRLCFKCEEIEDGDCYSAGYIVAHAHELATGIVAKTIPSFNVGSWYKVVNEDHFFRGSHREGLEEYGIYKCKTTSYFRCYGVSPHTGACFNSEQHKTHTVIATVEDLQSGVIEQVMDDEEISFILLSLAKQGLPVISTMNKPMETPLGLPDDDWWGEVNRGTAQEKGIEEYPDTHTPHMISASTDSADANHSYVFIDEDSEDCELFYGSEADALEKSRLYTKVVNIDTGTVYNVRVHWEKQ